MIVEFIGSTGAGKTTLISEVERILVPHARAATPFDLVVETLRLRKVGHPTLRNLIQDLVGLPFFVLSWRRRRALIAFAVECLKKNGIRGFSRGNYLRSLVRKLGMYEFVRRYGGDRIILVDEGAVSAAHLLFVFTAAALRREDIETFAGLVDLPDLLVYVNAPVDRLVQRSLERKDVRRELRSRDPRLVETYVGRSSAMFDMLAEAEGIRERLVVAGNSESGESARRAVADDIAGFIRGRRVRPAESFSLVGEPA